MTPDNRWKIYRFGAFEFDGRARELRKHGSRVNIQDQPLKVLDALITRPGVLVTREALHAQLWPSDTFVDFEHGLNTAAARLRQTLADSARRPRYIESIPRRGYRFIAAVEVVEVEPEAPAAIPSAALDMQTPRSVDGERAGADSGPLAAPRPAAKRAIRRVILASVAVLLAAGVTAWWARNGRSPQASGSYTFSLTPPAFTKFVDFDPPVVSPDGRFMLFAATEASGDTQLWLRPLNDVNAHPVEGTKGASFPFWSPDSRSFGFFAGGSLKRLETTGGVPKALCEAPEGRGGTWNRDDMIVFAPSMASPLMVVSAAGGEPKAVTTLDPARQDASHRWPYFLPDGRHFVFSVYANQQGNSGIFIGSLAATVPSLLFSASSNAVYVNRLGFGGYILFAEGTTVIGRAFDPDTLKLSGPEFPIAESPNRVNMEPQRADFTASDAGVLAYRPKRGTDKLTWFDRGGTRLETFGEPGIHLDLTLSRRETEIAYSRYEPHTVRYDVWRADRATQAISRLTYGSLDQVGPVWSPDGSTLFYSSLDLIFGSKKPLPWSEIHQISFTKGNTSKLLLKSDFLKIPWSANDHFLLYHELRPGKKARTMALPLDSDPKPVPLLSGPSNQLFAMFSPDGKWVAYVSDESGKQEVYVVPFNPGAASKSKWLVSSNGGSQPVWQADGSQLYYLAPDKQIMTVPISWAGGRFSPGQAQALFQPDIVDDFRARFAVTADGRRFLVPCSTDQSRSKPIIVVVNWSPPGTRRLR
jgi:DNA-binding winged helix-turn-helix (wHTH) protein/Tol biopolymer transport system component